ncbi:hypothetical protein [Amycolatopsis sp. La24]|uniref:hypothetical protein n=1 Tax=Amycolatopsis sp. La24 TaxID=3028304 RepID=UPI000A7C824D|nr:hypothetical protein [Amycolatopsis sp. La24]
MDASLSHDEMEERLRECEDLGACVERGSQRFVNYDVALGAMDALLHIDTPESRAVIASLVDDDRVQVRELARDVVANPDEYW